MRQAVGLCVFIAIRDLNENIDDRLITPVRAESWEEQEVCAVTKADTEVVLTSQMILALRS